MEIGGLSLASVSLVLHHHRRVSCGGEPGSVKVVEVANRPAPSPRLIWARGGKNWSGPWTNPANPKIRWWWLVGHQNCIQDVYTSWVGLGILAGRRKIKPLQA